MAGPGEERGHYEAGHGPWGIAMSKRSLRESPWGHTWNRESQGKAQVQGRGPCGWMIGSLVD